MMARRPSRHEEAWLLLPWLANGRLSHSERAALEEHVSECAACAHELERQRLMCRALTEPERVTYAPAPSFRKLMERIDAHAEPGSAPPAPAPRRPAAARALRAAWRPPGLAWAATCVLAMGLAVLGSTAYRWTRPVYATHTAAPASAAGVLHVAFDRTLSLGDMEQLLHSAGARVVEGPDASGIFGIAPTDSDSRRSQETAASAPLRALAARLRADTRVRWIQPLGADEPEAVAGRRTGEP
jgi:putative zinc finger protein